MKKFILESRNIERDSYLWHMIGSFAMAFQSVILLMFLTRYCGLNEAGVFTIAFANANLFLYIGKFGMRNFQVSDIKEKCTFAEYLTSRWITSIVMVLVSITYIMLAAKQNHYTFQKSMICFWMCLLKTTDAVEDVFCGLYQQHRRLDIASKITAIRSISTTVIFILAVIIFKNQLLAITLTMILSAIMLFLFIKWTYKPYTGMGKNVDATALKQLFQSCFPLFAGGFLAFYIGNAPKYAIDSLLSDDIQACYGFISMPVLVIGLLNGFIFNPMIYQMSCLWTEGKKKIFLKRVVIQICIIAGITMLCLLGAYFIGIPVLSFLYKTNLSSYKPELLILLLGGGFLCISSFFTIILTIIRFQKNVFFVYFGIALLACILSSSIVSTNGILGAAILYTSLTFVLSVCFGVLFGIGFRKKSFK